MLYFLFTTYRQIALLPATLFGGITVMGIVLYLFLAGSNIPRQAGRKNQTRRFIVLRLLIFLTLSISLASTAIWIMGNWAIQIGGISQPAYPHMLLSLIGAPPTVDGMRLLKFGGLVIAFTLIGNIVVGYQLRIGSGLRLWLDRFRAIPRTQDEYGSSHFATPQEYRRFRVPKPHGMTFYGKFFGKTLAKDKFTYLGQHFCLSPEDTARGILTIGNPGSGKTSSVILPMIFDSMCSGHSLVVADPQNELTKHVFRYARVTGHRVILHNPMHPKTPRFNLAKGIHTVSDARAVADVLVPKRAGDVDSFWNQSASMLLAACLLRFDNLGDIFASFSDLKTLGNILDETPDDAQRLAGTFINSIRTDMKLATNIVATLSTSLTAWADPIVCESTTKSDFSASALISTKPTVFVLATPGEHRQILAPYLGAVMTSILRELDTMAERLLDGKHFQPIHFVIDEFPTLGNLTGIVESVNLVRKRQISFLIAAQTLGQLHHIYGKNGTDVLLSGMAFQIIFGGCDQTTAEFYSQVTGMMTNRQKVKDQSDHLTARKLLTPDEIVRPPQGNCIIFGRYVTTEYATYVMLLSRLTRIYERDDVRLAIQSNKSKRLRVLYRPKMIAKPKHPLSLIPLTTPLCNLEQLTSEG